MTDTIKKITGLLMAAVVAFCLITPAIAEESDATAVKPKKNKITSIKKVSKSTMDRKIKVAWSKSKGAKKYELWKKEGSGKYKLAKTTKSLSATIEASTKVKVVVKFKVRGLNGKTKGKYSTEKKITLPRAALIQGTTQSVKILGTTETLKITEIYQNGKLIRGKTADGLDFYYEDCGNGRRVLSIAKMNEDKDNIRNKDYAWINSSKDFYLYFDVNQASCGAYDFKSYKKGYSLSWTLDGTKPLRNQGTAMEQRYSETDGYENQTTLQKLTKGKLAYLSAPPMIPTPTQTFIRGSLTPPADGKQYSYKFNYIRIPDGLYTEEEIEEFFNQGSESMAYIDGEPYLLGFGDKSKDKIIRYVVYDENGKRAAEFIRSFR